MSDALLQQIKALEEEVMRLKGQLKQQGCPTSKSNITESESEPGKKMSQVDERKRKGKGKKSAQVFDFSSHPRRHVALRLAYLGWDYQGFAVQENTDNTVEARLFEALLKTRLIQDRQSSSYHRCGRTDKGVSAFSQVITIDLRSTQVCGGLGVTLPSQPNDRHKAGTEELPYTKMLNRVLPANIRVLDWAEVDIGFSARFDCQSRTYRYYFPRGDLDVELMAKAAKRYEGTHDFRNLCKMDVGNGVLQFERTILLSSVQPVKVTRTVPSASCDLFFFEVKGLAFLYHQVRCMMAVLLLIGQKLETPDVIDKLLDVEKHPRKPQYSMAVDYPLVLYDCHFDGLSWQREPEEVDHVLATLQQHWTLMAVKAQVLQGMIQGLQSSVKPSSQPCFLLEGSKQRNYRPLLERPCCESLESRIEHFVKRGRLQCEMDEDGEKFVHRGKRSKHQDVAPSQPDTPKLSDL